MTELDHDWRVVPITFIGYVIVALTQSEPQSLVEAALVAGVVSIAYFVLTMRYRPQGDMA